MPVTEVKDISEPAQSDQELSPLALGSVLLRWRRTIAAFTLSGAIIGLAMGLIRPRQFLSTATFIPQGAETGVPAGLALAASQLGVRVPVTGGTWGPPIYVELLRSRDLLEPIARDTLTVLEEGRRKIAVMDLLGVDPSTVSEKRIEEAVRALMQVISASEDRKLGAVKLSVATRWPSVSFAVAERLVSGVNTFNLQTRKSQAAAERVFAETQAGEAEAALRAAEDRLQFFLQHNRSIAGSQELSFALDRLRRDVTLRQQVYSALVQNREEAKLREVRDTPVITVLEKPRLAIRGEARKSLQKAAVGTVAGAIFGMLIAFLSDGIAAARRAKTKDAREFFSLLEDATPRFLKRYR